MKDTKKKRNLIILGLITLFIAILGATYAFFTANTINNFGNSTINVIADDTGNVVLNGTNANLSLSLSLSDLMANNSHHYYASSDGTPSLLPNRIEIGETSVSGNGRYECEYTLTVTQSGDLYTSFQNSTSKSAGQILLMIGGQTFDFNTANLFPLTVTGTLTNLRSDNSKKIEALFKIINKTTVDQSSIAGKSININITATSFTCSLQQDRNYSNYLYASASHNTSTSPILARNPNYKALTEFESIEFLPTTNVPADGSVTPFDASQQNNGSIMASYTYNSVTGKYKLYVGQDGGVVSNSDCADLFSGFSNVISINLEYFDTSKATDMYRMFGECGSLTSLDLSSFDTSSVASMSFMFRGCSSLVSLDLSNFDTSGVTQMGNMFEGCGSLVSLDLSNFDTSGVTIIYSMFYNCSALTSLDVSSFDTSGVTSMQSMFRGCSSLVSLDLSNFDTSGVTSMYYMFVGCSSLTNLDVSSFDTSSVENMNGMFSGCSSLTSLNLSSFDTSRVENMGTMFNNCTSLETIYASDKFVTTGLSSQSIIIAGSMFTGCSSLVGGNNTHYSSDSYTYAWIDGKNNQPGYFTEW